MKIVGFPASARAVLFGFLPLIAADAAGQSMPLDVEREQRRPGLRATSDIFRPRFEVDDTAIRFGFTALESPKSAVQAGGARRRGARVARLLVGAAALTTGVYMYRASRGWNHFDFEEPPVGPLTVEGFDCKGGSRPNYGAWEEYDFERRCRRLPLSIPAIGLMMVGSTMFVGSFFF
jgi:hypothetical protein